MAGILGLTQAGLSKLERGDRLPTLEVLLKLRAFSGRPIDWILLGEEGGPGPRRRRGGDESEQVLGGVSKTRPSAKTGRGSTDRSGT